MPFGPTEASMRIGIFLSAVSAFIRLSQAASLLRIKRRPSFRPVIRLQGSRVKTSQRPVSFCSARLIRKIPIRIEASVGPNGIDIRADDGHGHQSEVSLLEPLPEAKNPQAVKEQVLRALGKLKRLLVHDIAVIVQFFNREDGGCVISCLRKNFSLLRTILFQARDQLSAKTVKHRSAHKTGMISLNLDIVGNKVGGAEFAQGAQNLFFDCLRILGLNE